MSSFHGFFSLGGLLGAALGGMLIGAGLGDGRGALMAGSAIAVVVALCAPYVLRVAPSPHESHFALPRGPALFLGSVAAHTNVAVALGVLAVSGIVIAANARVVKR